MHSVSFKLSLHSYSRLSERLEYLNESKQPVKTKKCAGSILTEFTLLKKNLSASLWQLSVNHLSCAGSSIIIVTIIITIRSVI